MTKLFLDDIRYPYDPSWKVVRNFHEFKAFCDSYNPEGEGLVVSFDHDLANEHYVSSGYTGPKIECNGEDCARYMIQSGIRPTAVIVHSWNPDGAKRIAQLFEDEGVYVTRKEY